MTDEEIIQQTIEVLAEEFELKQEQLKPEATLFDELGLDSLDSVDMVVALEKAFKVKMANDKAIRAVRTVDDLFTLVIRLKREE
jgi:acyl carrier protein